MLKIIRQKCVIRENIATRITIIKVDTFISLLLLVAFVVLLVIIAITIKLLNKVILNIKNNLKY